MTTTGAAGLSDRDLIAALKQRGYSVTKPKLDPKRLIHPLPVYVATFAGGEVTRFSLHCWRDKPLPFERGRSIAAQAIGNERGWAAIRRRLHVFKVEGEPREALMRAGWDYDADTPVRIGPVTVPAWRVTRWDLYWAAFPLASDQITGHFEVGNVIHVDQHFQPGRKTPSEHRPAAVAFETQTLFKAGGR